MKPVIVWGRPSSSNTQKVLWMLGEVGVPHELRLASARIGPGSNLLVEHSGAKPYGGTDTPEFLAMNPHRTVPTIRDPNAAGGVVALWESNTIVRYLAMKYGPSLHLGSVEGVSRCSMWMDFVLGADWYSSNHHLIDQIARTPKEERNIGVVREAHQGYLKLLQKIDDHLVRSGPYMLGDSFTAADVPVGVEVCRWALAVHAALRDGIELEIPALSGLRRFWSKLLEREAFRKGCYEPELAHQNFARTTSLTLPPPTARM
eukprot:TRINITY_DN10415_c0_g1_i1.p1 TRINITY_DN10415_c0_g1~~TRINITY_DN10415_c0_g1_i1.p1  ORF type:complete len:260 (+),score=54.53 TRINITY_DN10415_c0_g1_i1:78-857(+)